MADYTMRDAIGVTTAAVSTEIRGEQCGGGVCLGRHGEGSFLKTTNTCLKLVLDNVSLPNHKGFDFSSLLPSSSRRRPIRVVSFWLTCKIYRKKIRIWGTDFNIIVQRHYISTRWHFVDTRILPTFFASPSSAPGGQEQIRQSKSPHSLSQLVYKLTAALRRSVRSTCDVPIVAVAATKSIALLTAHTNALHRINFQTHHQAAAYTEL